MKKVKQLTLNDVIDKYLKLWNAVENGTIDEDFFELREDVRFVVYYGLTKNK